MAYVYPLARPGHPAPDRVDASQSDIDFALACRNDDAATVQRLVAEGSVDVNACVRLGKSWAGTPLILVGDPGIAELLIQQGAEVNTLYWGQGSYEPPFTALDSAYKALSQGRYAGQREQLERLVELLRSHGARTHAELSARGLDPVRPEDGWLSSPLVDRVPYPGERTHMIADLRRQAAEENPTRSVLAMCELATFGSSHSGSSQQEWVADARSVDPILTSVVLRYQRVGAVLTEDLFYQAMEDAANRLGLITAWHDGAMSDREYAVRAYLSLTLATILAPGDKHERMASALGTMGLVPLMWSAGGFSDVASVAADDGVCTALRLLEDPEGIDFAALDPSTVVGTSVETRAASVAVTCLEATRGLWVNQTFVLRRDLPERLGDTRTRARWQAVRDDLRASRRAGTSRVARREAEGDFRHVTNEIREIPGMERFLLPPSPTDLMSSVGADGVAVYLLSHEPWMTAISGGSDSWAIVVTAEAVSAVRLPLADDRLRSAYPAFMAASVKNTVDARLDVLDILGWVAEAILSPVASLIDGKTRLWWVPTGPFVGLPLSAAALVTTEVPASTDMDPRLGVISRGVTGPEIGHDGSAVLPWTRGTFVATPFTARIPPVQSVAATIGSLSSLQSIDPDMCGREVGLLGVPHTNVTGWGPLDQVDAEIDAVSDIWGGGSQVLPVSRTLPAAGADLRAAMDSSGILHFAGHATTEELVCSDETVSLVELVQRSRTSDSYTPAGQLAVLSACEALGRSASQSEFPVAVAVQLAAFTHVIGSTTPVFDRVAIEFSQRLHTHLRASGGPIDPAHALAMAVRELRVAYPGIPAFWAGWVHTGP